MRKEKQPHAVSHWLAPLFNLLLILLIAQEMAHLTWRVVWAEGQTLSPQTMHQAMPNLPSTPYSDKSGEQSHHAILVQAAMGLFGHSAKAEPLPQHTPPPEDTLDTKLPLTLLGIFFTNDQKSRALIGQPGQREKSYQNGDILPGNARITAIYSDRVLLKREQKYETLRLPTGNKTRTIAQSTRGGTTQLSPKVNSEVTKLWNRFRKRPESILTMVHLEPAKENGQFVGVRVSPGANKHFLKKFGLQAGDVVTWINGVELTDPLKGMAVLGQLASAEAVHFRVRRGAVSHTFDFYRSGKAPGKP